HPQNQTLKQISHFNLLKFLVSGLTSIPFINGDGLSRYFLFRFIRSIRLPSYFSHSQKTKKAG
ncbi:MAG: hypothetical protein ABIJ30_12315, partial [bacterium]